MSKFGSGAKTGSTNSSKTGSTSGRTNSNYKSNTTGSSTGGKSSGYGSQSNQNNQRKYSNTKTGNKYQAKDDKLKYKQTKSDAKLHLKENKVAGKKHNLQKTFDNQLKSELLNKTPTSHRAIAGGVTAALGLAVLGNRKRAAEMDTLRKIVGDWKDVESSKNSKTKESEGN